ncbi:MAG: DUF1566 domain-containing protein [Candidatus Omnitrophica bacterium]|nr:DUF1566 domain-containing protein [Candidatus Omnitrophota bacterium]
MLVASAQETAFGNERYTDRGDNTIADSMTGLLWIKDAAAVPELAGGQMLWKEAADACDDLVFADIGPQQWKLPLINSKFKNPQIDAGFFVCESNPYWSATPYTPGIRAWTVNFKNGMLGSYDKDTPDKPAKHYVRCVTRI